jgi:hypothetical protein
MQDVDQIFVSYHRADGAADAGRLADTLRVRFREERDDPSILNRARQAVPVDSQASELPGGIPEGLVSPLVDARYRLMVEEVGRELLKHGTAERVAEFLGDSALVEKIRKAWHEFEVEKRGWFDHRGDGSEDPGARQQEAMQLEARARGNLQAQLPGLTKHSETRQRLFEFVADQVTQILSTGVIRDFWEYTFLKQFSAYPDMPWELRVGDREKVESMLKRFEEPARD